MACAIWLDIYELRMDSTEVLDTGLTFLVIFMRNPYN